MEEYVIEICASRNSQFYWHIIEVNSLKVITATETYTRLWSCERSAKKVSKATGLRIVWKVSR